VAALLDAAELASDVVVVPHHGSSTSPSAFVAATSRVTLVSAGYANQGASQPAVVRAGGERSGGCRDGRWRRIDGDARRAWRCGDGERRQHPHTGITASAGKSSLEVGGCAERRASLERAPNVR
jgi:hypothetical protein